ncbi:MAG: JAB domain-containing protein, partial [Ectothiorhodospiraceae bacterium]|nr:JAB domain-containing protein [Ectothiorhodospiraceae bacterium]
RHELVAIELLSTTGCDWITVDPCRCGRQFKILFVELVSLGSVNATTVEPMNVFRVAILKNAVKVILVHNHPSGNLTPSPADKDVTDRLIQVGRIINVQAIDHLIISPESYLSFEHIGLFGMLEASMKWMPAYEIIENIREEERKIRKEAVQMADVKGERRGLRKGKKEGIGIGEERGEKKGYKKGERVGVKKGKVEMAKAMKKDKKPVEEIQKYTQLTKADIQAL